MYPGGKSIVRTVLQDHCIYRNKFGGRVAGGVVINKDLSWCGTLKQSAQQYAKLVEDIVYTTTYDHIFKQSMKSNQSVEESLQHQTVKELFTEVESSVADEASANNNSTLEHRPPMSEDLELRFDVAVGMTGSNTAETNAHLLTALVQADEETQDIVRKFEEEAKLYVSKYIKLIVMPQTAAELVNHMKEG